MNYLWDGNRQLQEQTDTHTFTTIYEQNSFEPLARLVWLKDELLQSANDEIIKAERESWEDEPKLIPNVQIYHYHNDHLGTPNELTNDNGEVVWLADYEAWGNTAKVVYKEVQLHNIVVSAEELQPIRFQGQSFDTETGLHYNRFRYFDPDLGMFTTRDPIGLLGGMNTFQYAPNPTGWIDPFGLVANKDCCKDNDDPCKGIVNYKSSTQFGHTFTKHGKAKVNSLKDTARSTQTPQGYWTNNITAANFISPYRSTKMTVTIPIPKGLGKVILSDGTVKDATKAIIIPMNRTGKCLRTAYPILK